MTVAPRRRQHPALSDPLESMPDPFDEDDSDDAPAAWDPDYDVRSDESLSPETRLEMLGIRVCDCSFCGQDGHRYGDCPNRPRYLWPDHHWHLQPHRG